MCVCVKKNIAGFFYRLPAAIDWRACSFLKLEIHPLFISFLLLLSLLLISIYVVIFLDATWNLLNAVPRCCCRDIPSEWNLGHFSSCLREIELFNEGLIRWIVTRWLSVENYYLLPTLTVWIIYKMAWIFDWFLQSFLGKKRRLNSNWQMNSKNYLT